MKSLLVFLLITPLISCAKDEKKKKTGSSSVAISLADIKYWTKSTTKLNGTLQSETKRTMGANGRPSVVEVFNANAESISKTTAEYNEANQMTKSTLAPGGENETTTTNEYDANGRLVKQLTLQKEKPLETREINYHEIKTVITVHDVNSDDAKVLQTSEEYFYVASTNIDGSSNFMLLKNGQNFSPDKSVHLELSSDCTAETKQGACTRKTQNLNTDKTVSEITSTHNIRAWNVEGREVLRDSISLEEGSQYNVDGEKTTEYKRQYTYNAKFNVSEAIETYTFPTDLQQDYTEYRVYSYDDTGLNLTEIKTRIETAPDEGNASVTERTVTYVYE